MGLDIVEMVVAIGERFRIDFPNADAATFRTSRDIIDYIVSHSSDVAMTREHVRDKVLAIVRDELGVEHCTEDDRFVEDLDAD